MQPEMKKLIPLLFIFVLNFFVFDTLYAGTIPDRIISLAPNITEILFSLGLGDKVIGVTNFCDYPDGAKKKPKIGGMSNPSLEAVVSLKPDIVLMTTDGNQKDFEERLRSLKIRTYVFKARRLPELPQGIRDLGSVLGVKEKADVIANDIEKSVNKLKNSKSKIQNPKKVLFIIWPEPLIVAGPGTAIDDVITFLGCENIASTAKVQYPKYSIEEIILQAPDVIFIGKGHTEVKKISQSLLKRIGMVPAVQNNAVFYISDSIYRLSPRIVNGIEEMAQCLK
jgi:iron complex transport system substrate-binding protein